ncbi:MAG: MFS transporter [Selenomonas sp.]|uniref:MFS transporter n=1 Tax=Selenomonas sp. TaxID=2053611 RepID=UPI0025E6E886|nr:MFS transporter [Selenomonas sp.]MCI6232748.1 MFS transporter [Selenomonas sp.]
MGEKRLLAFCALAGVLLYGVSAGVRGDIGLLLNPVAASSGQSYEGVSIAIALMQLAFGATQPLFGWLAMRRSNRFVLTLGAVSYAVGLALLPFVHSFAGILVAIGVFMGAGAGAICFGIILSAIVERVGERNAMIISGLLNASSGLGSTAFAPITSGLLAAGGLPLASLVLCAPMLVLIPVIFVMTAGRKKEEGNGEDGGAGAPHETATFREIFAEAFHDRTYRLLICGFSTCGFHMVLIEAHLFSQFVSYGIEETAAAWAFSVYGIATIAGALASGWLSVRMHKGRLLGFCYGFRAVLVALYLFFLPKTLVTAVIFAVGLGLTGDATVSPTSGLVNARFAMARVATLIGFLFLCHQIGAFLSAWLGGLCVTWTGGYTLVWCIDIATCSFAALASWRISSRRT